MLKLFFIICLPFYLNGNYINLDIIPRNLDPQLLKVKFNNSEDCFELLYFYLCVQMALSLFHPSRWAFLWYFC